MKVAPSQVTKMSLRTPDPLCTHRYVKVPMRLIWQYTSTDYTVHDSVCMQEHFSLKMGYVCYSSAFLNVKSVAQHLWKQYRLCDLSGVLFCYMPSCNYFA